jgi:hypothetical protein
MLFDGFADPAAFEAAGGRARLEADLRAFFLSPLPYDPGHLLQRLSVFDVRTGASGSGALVGVAVEFLEGAQGAQAALLLQKIVALLTQPALALPSVGFYGRPSPALSVEAYGGAVDPSLLSPSPTPPSPPPSGGGGGGGGSGGGGGGSGTTVKGKAGAGAVAGGAVGGLAALALLSFVAWRLLLRRRRLRSAPSSSPSPLSGGSSQQQQFIANTAADPTRPQATTAAPAATTT